MIEIHDGAAQKPFVTFWQDGTVEVRGDIYEAAKAFWDYVGKLAEDGYRRHSLPKLDNCGKYLAVDNKGQWHYINHAGTWQACPPPFPSPSRTPSQHSDKE